MLREKGFVFADDPGLLTSWRPGSVRQFARKKVETFLIDPFFAKMVEAVDYKPFGKV